LEKKEILMNIFKTLSEFIISATCRTSCWLNQNISDTGIYARELSQKTEMLSFFKKDLATIKKYVLAS
jgi:hypothetical protein